MEREDLLAIINDLESRIVAIESALKIALIMLDSAQPELATVARDALESMANDSVGRDSDLAEALRRLLTNT